MKRRAPSTYDVHWRARIALTYRGDERLAHSLDLKLSKLRLECIELEAGLEASRARALLATLVAGAGRYQLVRRRFILAKRR
ncbi:MAG: hypothetical protein QM756_16030 [Polyangiaceae bacterium]